MQDNLVKKNIIFSGLIFVSFILSIFTIIVAFSSSFFEITLVISIINLIIAIVCIIGTFVCSIKLTSNSKKFYNLSDKAKSTGIVGIVACSIGLLFIVLNLAINIPILALVADVLIIVTFAMSISLYRKLSTVKKPNEQSKNSNSEIKSDQAPDIPKDKTNQSNEQPIV